MSRVSLILSLLLVAVVATPAAWSVEDEHEKSEGPASAGPLETRGDSQYVAPDGTPRTGPAFHSASRGFFMTQVNTDGFGMNILGDAANEPSIAVDPTDPNKMCIGWRQFDDINSDFRQAGYGYTTDGGTTWTFPGRIETGIFRSDPVLSSDSSGNFYYNSLTVDFGTNDYWCHVFKSTDGGASWDAGTYAHGGDKQWQTIDQSGGVGDGNIYAYWNNAFTICNGHFTRSTNGGASFEDCISITGTPYWGTLDVAADGALYLCGAGFIVNRSDNAQIPGSTITWDLSTTVDLDGSILYSGGPNPDGLMGQSQIAVDKSGGVHHGNVYLICSVNRSTGPDLCDVMFARSTDGGNSWGAPLRVNDDPGDEALQWFGTMSVAPNGRIDVVWLDTREDPGPGNFDSSLYYAYSEDGGQTFSVNERLTTSFDPHLGWPQQSKMGDYFDMVSDNDGANLAFAGTWNGEQDVYFARITRTLAVLVPDGVPEMVSPGVPTDIAVWINDGEENYIPGSATLHYRFDGGAWQTLPLVHQGGDDYLATLPGAACTATPEFYFSAQGDQTGLITSPADAPATVYSAVVGDIVTFYSEPMDVDPGWATEGQWAFGQPTGGGGEHGYPDPTSGYTGTSVYGYNLDGDYPNDMPEYHLTTDAIDCTGKTGVILTFQRWLGVEVPNFDHAYLRYSLDGSTWQILWENPDRVEDSQWTEQVFDISAWADNQPTVYFRWTMGTTDSSWPYCGWNIDDVTLSSFVCEESVTDTVSATLDANPGSGTLPFVSQFTAQLSNLTGENRRAAGRINVVIGNGTPYTNWRAGWTNLSPGETFSTSWNQNLPALGTMVGSNVFTLLGQDVTPAPYNQPPFLPSGDTDSDSTTVIAVAP